MGGWVSLEQIFRRIGTVEIKFEARTCRGPVDTEFGDGVGS